LTKIAYIWRNDPKQEEPIKELDRVRKKLELGKIKKYREEITNIEKNRNKSRSIKKIERMRKLSRRTGKFSVGTIKFLDPYGISIRDAKNNSKIRIWRPPTIPIGSCRYKHRRSPHKRQHSRIRFETGPPPMEPRFLII
jgi:hypothetical protein